LKAAELLVECLKNEGVNFIFGLPGEENMIILDALLDSDIKFITTRHEQGAAFMADVYGRLSGKAGVCLSTLGPGATNLLTGVADANLDHGPLVALTGQASLDRLHKESHQHIDIVSVFHPVTKWNALVQKPEIIPEVIRKAFKIAEMEKPGATHLDLPEDVMGMEVESVPLYPKQGYMGHSWVPEPQEEAIRKAKKLIDEAKYPVVLAGNGVARRRADAELLKFAERLNIPVCTTFMGKGGLSDKHRLSLGTVGLQARDYVSCGFERADLIIAVGYDLVEFHPRLWNPDGGKKILHIDSTSAEVDAWYNVEVEVVGEIGSALAMLSDICLPKDEINFTKSLRELIVKELSDFQDDNSFPLKPQRIISDLRKILRDDDILISDVGMHKLWLSRLYPTYKTNTCVISNGFASMGIAVPGAVSAKLLEPEKKIIAATGDGGFLMNSQEIETAVRVGTPFVILVFRDNRYGVIEWKQLSKFKRSAFIEFSNPSLTKYAESFGAKAYKVESADELVPVLKEALNNRVVTIIDCPVDYTENFRLLERLGQITCPV
jgi:acetolactate synthase-1/2/3 large subunit